MSHNSYMSRNNEFSSGRSAKNQAEQDAQDFHASLAPMKESIRSQGASFASVSGHLRKNATLIFGRKMAKKDTLAWAAKKHSEDSENFLKNIGFRK